MADFEVSPVGAVAELAQVKAERDALADDLEDMMILGYSSRRMARELGVEKSTVLRHIRAHISPSRRVAWLKDGKRRHAEAAREQLARYHGRVVA